MNGCASNKETILTLNDLFKLLNKMAYAKATLAILIFSKLVEA